MTERKPWEPSNPLHWNGSKTECCRGHEFTQESTYIRPDGRRMCRICDRDDHRSAYAGVLLPDRERLVERDEWMDGWMGDPSLRPMVRLLLHSLAALADEDATSVRVPVTAIAELLRLKRIATSQWIRRARESGWLAVDARWSPHRYLFVRPVVEVTEGGGPTAA